MDNHTCDETDCVVCTIQKIVQENHGLKNILVIKEEAITNTYDSNIKLHNVISDLQSKLEDKEKTISEQSKTINDQTKTIDHQSKIIDDQSKIINGQSKTISDQCNTITVQDNTIAEKDEIISQLQQQLSKQLLINEGKDIDPCLDKLSQIQSIMTSININPTKEIENLKKIIIDLEQKISKLEKKLSKVVEIPKSGYSYSIYYGNYKKIPIYPGLYKIKY